MTAVYASGEYHAARLPADARRDVLWQALWRYYFSRRIAPGDCVLDLGAGHGSFINAVVARRRIAVDAWPGFAAHLAPGVEAVVGPVTELDALPGSEVDYAFASNLFEHLTQAELAQLLRGLAPKLSARGTLTLVQPNWRHAMAAYFDDYTHVSIWSDVSMADFLAAQGWEVMEVRPRFLPLTIKSRLPVWPLLIAAYLASPIKPMAGQMLIRARPKR
jgi:hypothetical protein